MNRSIIVIFSFTVVFSLVSAEPIRYYRQPFRASARQTNNGLAFEAGLGDASSTTTTAPKAVPEQNEDEEKSEQTTENAPYKVAGWKPTGNLLVLPFEVSANQNFESTTTVESTTFDDEPTSTENPTTGAQAKGEQLELETSEPKTKTAAYKRPPLKVSGALKAEVASSDDSSESNESTSTTTESNDESESTTVVNGALETTSEPNSEAVDVENTKSENPASNQQPQLPQGPFQPAFFVQLPDGSYQRIVYFPAQPPSVQPVATAANVQFQQLVQPQVTPFGFNPIANPRIVTFSSQYQAF